MQKYKYLIIFCLGFLLAFFIFKPSPSPPEIETIQKIQKEIKAIPQEVKKSDEQVKNETDSMSDDGVLDDLNNIIREFSLDQGG